MVSCQNRYKSPPLLSNKLCPLIAVNILIPTRKIHKTLVPVLFPGEKLGDRE